MRRLGDRLLQFALCGLLLALAPIVVVAQETMFTDAQDEANEATSGGDGVNSRSGNMAAQIPGAQGKSTDKAMQKILPEAVSSEGTEQQQAMQPNPRDSFVGLGDSAINTDSIVGIFSSPLNLFYQVTGDTCPNCQASTIGAEGELHRRNALSQQYMEFTEEELRKTGGLRSLAWRGCIQTQMKPPPHGPGHTYPDALDICQDKQLVTVPAVTRGDRTGVSRTMAVLYPFHPLNLTYGTSRPAINAAWLADIDDLNLERTYNGISIQDYPYAVTVWTSLLLRHYIQEWPTNAQGAKRYADLWRALRFMTGDRILQYGQDPISDPDPSTAEIRRIRISPEKRNVVLIQELAADNFASFARRIARSCFAREGRTVDSGTLGSDEYKDPVAYGMHVYGPPTAIQFTRSGEDLADQFSAALNGIVVPQEVIDSFLYMGMQELNKSGTQEPGEESICRKFYDSRCPEGSAASGTCGWCGLDALDQGQCGGHTARTYAMKMLANMIAGGKFYTALKMAKDLTNQLTGGTYDGIIKAQAQDLIKDAAGLAEGESLESAIRTIDRDLLKIINDKKEDFANDSKGGGKKFKDPFQSNGDGLGSFGG